MWGHRGLGLRESGEWGDAALPLQSRSQPDGEGLLHVEPSVSRVRGV
jgi:hypothetical protein